MSSHNPESGDPVIDERAASALRTALTDLAATMPEDPHRVDGINARVRRLGVRRQARRVTVVAVTGAATLATAVALQSRPTDVSLRPAAADSTTVASTSPLPTCTATLAALPPGSLLAPTTARGSQTTDAGSATGADQSKQARADAADAADHAATGVRGVKGLGTIARAGAASVTISVAASDPSASPEITATISADVTYLDGKRVLDAQPPLHPGDRVFFATVQADDGRYELTYLQVHPPRAVARASTAVDPAAKAAKAAEAASAEDESPYVKALATVVAAEAGSITLRITDGSLAGETVTAATGSGTRYAVNNRQCVAPELSVGMPVAVVLLRGDHGAYSAREVDLFQD